MIEPRYDEFRSKIGLKCIIDSPEEIEEMQYFFSEEEINRIKSNPDPDGKFRFLVEVTRIIGTTK